MSDWDYTADLVVVGSGAGGMTAALAAHDLGMRSLVVEKSALYGGSSAMSGGVLWVPNNPLLHSAGRRDSTDSALAYLRSETAGRVADDCLCAFLEAAPRMVSYLLERSHLELTLLADDPDFDPHAPGARVGGRSLEPRPFNGALLGNQLAWLRPPHPSELALGRVALSVGEARLLASGSPRGLAVLVRLLAADAFDTRARRLRRPTRLTLGNALVGRLRRSLLDRGLPLWLRSPVRGLVVDERRVVGVVVERDGRRMRVGAQRGVVLAAGGFERSDALRQRYESPSVNAAWSAGSPENVGDGLELGTAVGGTLELTDEAWWTPTMRVPGAAVGWPLVIEKALPGSIIVNPLGDRFTNEAAPHSDVVRAIFKTRSRPAYLVFDGRFRGRYPCGPVLPGRVQPDWALPPRLKQHFLRTDATLAGLADQLGIDGTRLQVNIERFNTAARSGRDPEFRRGESAYDRYWGDPKVVPNPCLAPLERPPFYAVEVYPGDLGTKGGLVTDDQARVLDASGEPIGGLFATGNCTASVMGIGYPAAGATLGPAMTFGFVAAHAASGITGH